MAVNQSNAFQADIEAYIADKTLPLTRRQLVVYQFGDPLTLPKGRGVTYTATRYNRVPLPYAPLSEGVPPIGELMTIQQVTATALQWGDKITITDVAEMTIKHPLFKKAIELTGLQIAETLERNTFNNLMGGAQINYVNSRGSRDLLQAGDVLNIHELNRAYAMLVTLGAPRFMGDEMTDTKLEADAGGAKASNNPRRMPHFVAVQHPFVAGDLRENQPIQYAWSQSDINQLYNYEIGEWSGIRFCRATWCRPGPASRRSTRLRRNRQSRDEQLLIIVVTASDTQNQYECQIYQVSTEHGCCRAERFADGRAAGSCRLHLQCLRRHQQRAGQSRALRCGTDCRAAAGAGDAACRRADGDRSPALAWRRSRRLRRRPASRSIRPSSSAAALTGR